MKKTLIKCIIKIHDNWKKEIRLYHEKEKLYISNIEKYYDKIKKTTIEFGDIDSENVTKAREHLKKLI